MLLTWVLGIVVVVMLALAVISARHMWRLKNKLGQPHDMGKIAAGMMLVGGLMFSVGMGVMGTCVNTDHASLALLMGGLGIAGIALMGYATILTS